MKNHQQFTKIISIMLCLVLMFSSTPNVFAVDIGDSASSADALLQKNVSEISEEIVLNETKIGTFSSDIRQKVFSFTPDEDGKYVIKIDSEYYTQTTVQDSENNWVNDNSGYSYSFVLSLSANNSYKISTSLWEDASNGTYDITIEKAIAATSLEIIQDTDIGYVGEYGYLYTVFGPENATEESITWESSNSDVVKIIDIYNDALLETGHVRLEFVSAGEVAITATSENGLTDSINFTVTERPNATSIVIENGDNITGFVGITQQLWANFFPEGSLSEDLTWTSDDETVATIDENGYVTFLNTGNVNITVTSERGLTDTCTITVEDFETIEVDQEKNVILDDKTEAYYYFTPEEDGYYIFYSYNNDYDTYGYILNSDMEEIASDDDSGDDNNFKVGCQLEAGATYILKARFYNTEDKGSFTICVEKSRYITGLEIVSMPEKTEYIEGSDVNSIDYDGLELKVTWSDGTTTDWAYEYDWWIEDEEFCIDVAAFAETGEVVLICGEASVKLTFTIIENPVDHIELVSGTKQSYVENYNGYVYEDEDGEYFYYYTYSHSDATIKIVYTDGTSTTAQVGDSVNGYDISWNDNQDNEPWVVGTNNKSIVEYLGHTVVLPITVKENTVTGIEIVSGKITCIENAYGYETEEGLYHYYYDIPHDVTIRITYSDETSKVVSIYDVVDGHGFDWEADQYENPWALGDDNYLTVSYLGHEALLPVSIIECPVESIVINSAPTREYIYGDIEYGYLSPDGEYEFYPTDLSGLSFTVYYFDGTNKTFTADDIDEYGYINGYRYELHYDEYNAQIGDFPVEFMYMGKTADYVVQLKESIASSITVTKQPNKTEYGSYYRPDFIGMELTITFADESTKVVTLTEDNLVYEFNPWWGELMYTVDIDGYNLTLAPYYGEDDMHYVAYYLGASCDILDVIFTEEKEISSIELDNVSWNGDGMTVKITYADETTETLTLDLVDFFDYEDSTASGCGMTGKGFLCYHIETYYDNNGSVEEYIVYIFDRQITVKADAILLGDVNSDGSVDNLDCLILTRYLANWDGYTEADINMAASDVNQDDSVDNLDCLILTRHLANWEGYEVLGIN